MCHFICVFPFGNVPWPILLLYEVRVQIVAEVANIVGKGKPSPLKFSSQAAKSQGMC